MIEQDLTELFEHKAAGTAPPVGLLRASLARSRRRRMQRRAAGLAAVVALGAGGAVVLELSPGRSSALDVAHTVELQGSPDVRATFPYMATHLPPGTSPEGEVQVVSQLPDKTFGGSYAREAWSGTSRPDDEWLALNISHDVDPATPVTTTTTTVRGHAATVKDLGSSRIDGRAPANRTLLTWEETPGAYFEVSYDGERISLDEAKAFAEGLVKKDDVRVSDIHIASMVDGAALVDFSSRTLILGEPPLVVNKDPYLSVFACKHATFTPTTGMTPTTLDGRTYLLKRSSPSKVVATKDLGDGTDLVTDFGGRPWTDAELAQVLEGLTYTGPTPAEPVQANTC